MDLDDFFAAHARQQAKAIPSKVYYNRFEAISNFIHAEPLRCKLSNNPYYHKIKLSNNAFKLDHCRKLLWNSWSTEYAFNVSSQTNESDYYKFALHWHFPQAYYSVYLAMTAYHETQGIATEQHEKSIKNFGNSVKHGHYPKAISFYASGFYKETKIHGLDEAGKIEQKMNILKKASNTQEIHEQIAGFLKSTREQNALNKRNRGLTNYQKDSRFQTKKGNLTSKFMKKHWDIIYGTLPETTIMNILYRMRIKANYHDIQAFMDADIDFIRFHSFLGEVVWYLNYVHEGYIHKAIGDKQYQGILNDFRGDSLFKARDRYNTFTS